jgi:hypothetical protein
MFRKSMVAAVIGATIVAAPARAETPASDKAGECRSKCVALQRVRTKALSDADVSPIKLKPGLSKAAGEGPGLSASQGDLPSMVIA